MGIAFILFLYEYLQTMHQPKNKNKTKNMYIGTLFNTTSIQPSGTKRASLLCFP